MLRGNTSVRSVTGYYQIIDRLPQLYPDEGVSDFSHKTLAPLIKEFTMFCPLLLVPQRDRSMPRAILATPDQKAPKTAPHRRQSRHKKDTPPPRKSPLEDIQEENPFAVTVEYMEHVVGGSCCGADYCHHYAYAAPNHLSFAAFADNFYNGTVPGVFLNLWATYEELMAFDLLHPGDVQLVRSILQTYMEVLKYSKVGLLKCSRCIFEIINEMLCLYEEFEHKVERGPVPQKEGSYVYYLLDTAITKYVRRDTYFSDVEKTINPVDNFVYQSLYTCFVSYLRDVYMSIFFNTELEIRFGVHFEVMEGVPHSRMRMIHLGYLADAIRATQELPRVYNALAVAGEAIPLSEVEAFDEVARYGTWKEDHFLKLEDYQRRIVDIQNEKQGTN